MMDTHSEERVCAEGEPNVLDGRIAARARAGCEAVARRGVWRAVFQRLPIVSLRACVLAFRLIEGGC